MSMGLRSFFQFTGGMLMLAVTSAKLFSVTLALLLFVVVPLILAGRRLRRLSRESQDRIADSSEVAGEVLNAIPTVRSEEQTSELQSLMRISYAVLCLKKKKAETKPRRRHESQR